MLKRIKFGERIFVTAKNITINKRTFLTEAYRCDEAWKRRFDSPVIQKVNAAKMFVELEQQFNAAGKLSAVDVDIFANAVKDEYRVNELLDVLLKLRASTETSNTMDSTHYAVIRYLLDYNSIEELHEVLNDRLHYGIFPDHYCCNILMDKFVKKEDYASAAKIASLTMLQEDDEHPLCNLLSIYSCYKYLENPDTWQKPAQEEDVKEEIKVRVAYIRNPYFDDHFDLVDPKDLVGKTLAFHGKHMNDVLGRTCQLRGLILYKKYEAVSKLMAEWIKNIKDDIVYEEIFNLIDSDNSRLSDDEKTEEFKILQDQINNLKQNKLCKDSLVEAIENRIKSAVEECTEKDIAQQCQNFVDWEKKRISILESQLEEINRKARMEEIVNIKKDLQEKERFLTFFEHEEQIELELEKKAKQEEDEIAKLNIAQQKARKRIEEAGEENYVSKDIRILRKYEERKKQKIKLNNF